MNVFYLDRDARKCAKYHCTRHMLKMATEYAQLASTAVRRVCGEKKEVLVAFYDRPGGKRVELKPRTVRVMPNDVVVRKFGREILKDRVLYLETHHNHPCSVWTRQSYDHFMWLCQLGLELCKEYCGPYLSDRQHAAKAVLEGCLEYRDFFNKFGWQDPPKAMPEAFHRPNTVDSYRAFYQGDKVRFAGWSTETTDRKEPDWWRSYNYLTMKEEPFDPEEKKKELISE